MPDGIVFTGKGERQALNKKTHCSHPTKNDRFFDGDLIGRACISMDNMTFVQASIDILYAKDLIGRTITTVSNGVETTHTLTAEDLNDRGVNDEFRKYIEIQPEGYSFPIAICAYTHFSDNGDGYACHGVYYTYVEGSFYTKVLNYLPEPKENEEIVFPIHPKYLPNRREYGTFEVSYSVYTDNSGEKPVERYRWDKTRREVDQAYKEGKMIMGKSPDGYMLYNIVADPGIMYVFLEVGGFFNILYLR